MTLPDDQQHAAAADHAHGSASAGPEVLKPVDLTVKETFESLVVALILAFVFRSFVVEAFIIPTGSMAPTLLGQHLRITDPTSGYTFNIDADEARLPYAITATSPMTGQQIALPAGTPSRAGDRILVLKYLYMLVEPKRWDVVVFKAPHEPETNYIKRLVGLPGETVALLDGNVYVSKPDTAGFEIVRKGDRPEVQRSVFQPIYHSRYVPIEAPGASAAAAGYDSAAEIWQCPWTAVLGAPDWQLGQQRSYRYAAADTGTIAFDFGAGDFASTRWMYPYNQLNLLVGRADPIEDVRLAATFTPDQPGLSVTLATTARLDWPDGRTERVQATVSGDGQAALQAVDLQTGESRTLATGSVAPLPPGRSTSVELWYVDQALILWVEGHPVLRYEYDLPLATLEQRSGPPALPEVTITVSGSPVTLHDVELDRDLFYNVQQGEELARGGFLRRRAEQPARGETLVIPPDTYWCIGDNTPLSNDGRYWTSVNSWVRHRMFDLDVERAEGLVPRRLMVGRAFFVYLPAPFPYHRGGVGVLPNFSDMRFIH